jgi:serine/threonine protein kinase/HEAT repeat protein
MSTEPTEPSDIVGTILNKKYQVLERLSQGGMGVVYRARHLTLDTSVALKVLLRPEETEAQERFLSEARLASKIRHPNTVYIADFGVLDDGRAFLEMEFLAGRTLAAELRKGPIEPLRACNIAMQIARGLQAVHEKGIIHRDMKPDNVFLLEQDGTSDFVKIVDFGIAKVTRRGDTPDSGKREAGSGLHNAPTAPIVAKSLPGKVPDGFTQSGTVMGTPGYMAPEQISGDKLDVRVDQYSLGCMLFEMLAGEPMFEAPSTMALLAKHITVPPPELRKKYPKAGVSKSLQALVLRLLAKDAGGRLRSMREVEAELQHEIDSLLKARGQRKRLSVDGMARYQPAGVRLPWPALLGLAAVLVCGSLYLGYRLLRGGDTRGGISSRELKTLREAALRVLREDVQGGTPELQTSALLGLGLSRDEALRPELENFLRRPEVPLRAGAATALGELGDRRAIPSLGGLLDRPGGASGEQPQVLVAAASALRQLGDPRGQRFLEQTLDTKDQETQFRVALLFCESGPQDAQRVLRDYAGRGGLPEPTRLNILGCLARAGDNAAQGRLQAALNETGPVEPRLAAAAKLAQLGDSEGLKFLRDLVRKRGREQLLAAQALAQQGEADGIDLFRQLVSNREAQPAARQVAAEALASVGEGSDARALGELMEGASERSLAHAAARAIVQIASRDPGLLSAQSLAWAQSALADSDAQLRQSAVEILGNSLGSGAVSLLSGLLHDSDARVRRTVVSALSKQVDDSTPGLLRDALRDSERSVRIEALRALQRISETAGPASPLVGKLRPALRDALPPLVDAGSPQERARAAGLLLRLGDEGQRQRLRDYLAAPDPELRRWALDQLPAAALTADELAALTSDAAPDVRLAAARRLADRGDRRAIPVLRTAAEGTGPDAVMAAALLGRLAPEESRPDGAALLQKLLREGDTAKRIEVVSLLGNLPIEQARPLLLQALRDRDPLVRRMVVEATSELADADANEASTLLPLAKRLVADRDATVHARAAALVARLSQMTASKSAATSANGESNPQSRVEPARRSSPADAGSAEPEASPPAGGPPSAPPRGSGGGLLIVEGPPGVQFAVDKRPWQAVSERPIPLEAGPHTVNFVSGERQVVIVSGQTVRLKIPISQVEQLVRSGLESFAKNDFKKAQRQLEKATSLCSREGPRAVLCANLTFEPYYRLGEIHEQAREWPEAMTEYQRLLSLSAQVKGRGDLKSATGAAVARLSPKLGQVVVSKRGKRGCTEDTIWLRPGTHSIKVESKFEQIEVKARDVLRIGKCP